MKQPPTTWNGAIIGGLDAARVTEILAAAKLAPCIDSLGIQFHEFGPGHCKLTARHDPRFNGLLSGFHGGMLAMVADCVAWFTIVTHTGPREPLLTTDLNTRYLSTCAGDVTAVGRLIKLGRTLCPVAVDLYEAGGKHVAHSIVTYMRLTDFPSDVTPPKLGEVQR